MPADQNPSHRRIGFEQGDYTAQINCITVKIVMILIVGPKLEEARKHERSTKFSGRLPARTATWI